MDIYDDDIKEEEGNINSLPVTKNPATNIGR
jgi:hypothetical protein